MNPPAATTPDPGRTSRSTFLAYPLSGVPDLAALELFVDTLRSRFEDAGWHVLPEFDGPERIVMGHELAPSRVLASNIAGVTGADVLVLLLPDVPEPTSVWVELGMALAARRSLVVVAPPNAVLPYLARLALAAGTHTAKMVEAKVPGEPTLVDKLVERVVAATNSVLH